MMVVDAVLHRTWPVASQQSRPQSRGLQNLGSATGAGLSTACARCRWVEATFHCWSSIQQAIIDQAIDQWQVRPRACIRQRDWHFRHFVLMFWCCTVCARFSLECFI